MRIATWNCCGRLGTKWDALAALRPDIAVICESTPITADQRGGTSELNLGYDADRGLSLLSFPGASLKALDDAPRVPCALAARVSGRVDFTLIGVWTVRQPGRPSYVRQIAATIEAYREELASGQAVLAGDFNCWAVGPKPSEHLANVERLRVLGMVSAYHEHGGLRHGEEPDPTFYMRFLPDEPFHCDFMFVPRRWAPAVEQVTVGTFAEWVGPKVSDHVPILAELNQDAL